MASWGTQIIAVPLQSGNSTSKISPFKTVLPKAIINSPVILTPSQRIGGGDQHHSYSNSPRTPQHLMSPATSDQIIWSGKRPHDFDDYSESKRSRKGEKGGKGLRHFSMKVCEKVQKKGTTSYNEVADELVAEFSESQRHLSPSDQAYDQKNIRRRVYDALNVLMAMNIISKEKKEIKWLGLPTNSAQECQNLEVEKQRRLERIAIKNQQLQDLILQQISFKNLVERNKSLEAKNCIPPPNSAIKLPFIIVNTDKKTVIDCSISNDKTEYLFSFDNTFEIHDDIEVLKRMGLAFNLHKGSCSPADLEKARQLVPKALEPYVIQMAQGGGNLPPGMTLTSVKSELSDSFIPSSQSTDAEVAMATAQVSGYSRPSSVGSLSDLPSRPGTSTPSEDFSDMDSEDPMSPDET